MALIDKKGPAAEAARVARAQVKALAPNDRQMRFRNMHELPKFARKPRTRTLQFYSSNPNIGNYLPVAGIHRMIGHQPDVWDMHRPVDFGWVNRNYEAVILGGAGLLASVFDPFWRAFADRCELPAVMWGLGVCLPDHAPVGVDRAAVREVARRAEHVDVRDDLTAEYYDLDEAHIGACPTIEYLAPWSQGPCREQVTVAAHPGLAGDNEHAAIVASLRDAGHPVTTTTNVQSRRSGVDDLLERFYVGSRAVVTTRLHGAIIAYGLGVPYVAVARDEKVRAFHRLYGGGVVVEDVGDVAGAVAHAEPASTDAALREVRSFGELAKTAVA